MPEYRVEGHAIVYIPFEYFIEADNEDEARGSAEAEVESDILYEHDGDIQYLRVEEID